MPTASVHLPVWFHHLTAKPIWTNILDRKMIGSHVFIEESENQCVQMKEDEGGQSSEEWFD